MDKYTKQWLNDAPWPGPRKRKPWPWFPVLYIISTLVYVILQGDTWEEWQWAVVLGGFCFGYVGTLIAYAYQMKKWTRENIK